MSFDCFGGSYATKYNRTCSTQSTTIPTKTPLGGCSAKTLSGLEGASWFQGNSQNLQNLLGGLIGKIDTPTSALHTKTGDTEAKNCGKDSFDGSTTKAHRTGGSHHGRHDQLVDINKGLPDNNIANESLNNAGSGYTLAGNETKPNASLIAINTANANSAVATASTTTAS